MKGQKDGGQENLHAESEKNGGGGGGKVEKQKKKEGK